MLAESKKKYSDLYEAHNALGHDYTEEHDDLTTLRHCSCGVVFTFQPFGHTCCDAEGVFHKLPLFCAKDLISVLDKEI